MKLGFTLDLLLQGAVDRMRAADEVWLAVPATRRGRDRDSRVHRLCRLIGLGLMAINVARDRVEVLAEPGPYGPACRRAFRAGRRPMLSEHARRSGDPFAGRFDKRQPIMTAYRQQALACAALLQIGSRQPQRSPRSCSRGGAYPPAQRVWVVRTQRARRVRLTALGEAALQRWPRSVGQCETKADEGGPAAISL